MSGSGRALHLRAHAFAALASLGLLMAAERHAVAQACCSGAATLAPGRLGPAEFALVGVQAKTGWVHGAYGSRGAYAGSESGAHEVDLEQSVVGTVRVARRGQLSLLVPFAETWRTTPATGSEVGAGLGDVALSGRYDFILAGTRAAPGVALLAGVTAPTGRSADTSTRPLATDATGTSVWQAAMGLALEQSFGPWLPAIAVTGALRAPRMLGPISSQLGPQLSAAASLGYAFFGTGAVGASLAYSWEADASANSVPVSWSGRQLLRGSVSGMRALGETWRLLGTVYGDLPVDHLGQNYHASIGLTLGVMRSFL
jgi:hypothetical protein